MNSKVTFYSLVGGIVLIAGFITYRLFFASEPLSQKIMVTETAGEKKKVSSGLRFSDSVSDGSVWSDPRIKNAKPMGLGDIKAKAEIENNLKNLTDLYDQGLDEDFLGKLHSLIAANPNVKEYAALLGDYYYNEGNWVEAENAVRRLVELDPQNSFAKTSLAEVVAIQGKYEDGLKMENEVLATHPDNIDAMAGIISIADMMGNRAEGLKTIEAHFSKDKTNGNAAAVYADALFMEGKNSEAESVIQEGLQGDPQNPILNRTAASIAVKNGNAKAAIQYSAVAAENEKDPSRKIDALHISWQARLQIKDYDGAERDLRKILEFDGENEVAQQGLRALAQERKGS